MRPFCKFICQFGNSKFSCKAACKRKKFPFWKGQNYFFAFFCFFKTVAHNFYRISSMQNFLALAVGSHICKICAYAAWTKSANFYSFWFEFCRQSHRKRKNVCFCGRIDCKISKRHKGGKRRNIYYLRAGI